MNWEKLRRNIGYKVRLVPAACHLDAAGDLLPPRDEEWTIIASGTDFLEIDSGDGSTYRLGKDHFHHFTTDTHRSQDGQSYGFLTLHIQMFIRGIAISVVPNARPGASVDPPPTDRTARARVHFIPEIERLFRRQLQVLDRCLLNFGLTSNDKTANPPDTWASLRPNRPFLYPNAAPIHELSATDAELLAEFHGALYELTEIIDSWISTGAPPEYNHWNLLMHKVEQSVSKGVNLIRKFCADRHYDATMPASGTLLSRSAVGLSRAKELRAAFIERKQAEHTQAAARRLTRPSTFGTGAPRLPTYPLPPRHPPMTRRGQ